MGVDEDEIETETETEGRGRSPKIKSALLWGAVGALSFLVLVQGYALLVGPLVTVLQGAAIASLVGVAAAGGAYVLEHRVSAWSARRASR